MMVFLWNNVTFLPFFYMEASVRCENQKLNFATIFDAFICPVSDTNLNWLLCPLIDFLWISNRVSSQDPRPHPSLQMPKQLTCQMERLNPDLIGTKVFFLLEIEKSVESKLKASCDVGWSRSSGVCFTITFEKTHLCFSLCNRDYRLGSGRHPLGNFSKTDDPLK